MQITIEIPEWAEKNHIYVFAGIELLAYRHLGQPVKIKELRCDKCGDCCRNIKGNFPPQTNGVCDYLRGNICGLGTSRPFSCGFPNLRFDCAETFK